VLNLLPPAGPESAHARRWRRARSAGITELMLAGEGARHTREQALLNATPAADTTLSEAAKLAGAQPVGSHHLLLAALADPESAAARALTLLGVNLGHAREALRDIDVTGTSDELPEEAGRRRMVVHVAADRLTLEAADPVLVKAGNEALAALGDRAREPGTIPGYLPVSASLSRAWQALFESLTDIKQRATSSSEVPAESAAGASDQPAAGASDGPAAGAPGQPAAGASDGPAEGEPSGSAGE
jgi:ATP-dependent Clp protease ATP-binding subunit ClpC